jgi:hypothetical protein
MREIRTSGSVGGDCPATPSGSPYPDSSLGQGGLDAPSNEADGMFPR